jgi:hypothetical protein
MKTLILAALATVFGTEPAEAKCGCGADLMTTSVVEGQPTIVIETSCADKDPKLKLADADGNSTAITLTATHDGYRNTQYVFLPDRALAPGSYKVTLANRAGTSEHALTVVTSTPNASPPTWTGTTTVMDQIQAEYGCGPAKQVKVRAGASAVLAFVELVEDSSKQRTTGYVRVQNGAFVIGHGMCGGAFALTRGRGYTATAALLAPERGTSSSSKTVSFTYAP